MAYVFLESVRNITFHSIWFSLLLSMRMP